MNLKIDPMTEIVLDAFEEEPYKTRWENLAKQELRSAYGDRDAATASLIKVMRETIREGVDAVQDELYRNILEHSLKAVSYTLVAEFIIECVYGQMYPAD